VLAGTPASFLASPSSDFGAANYTWFWGDGSENETSTNSSSGSGTVHTFHYPGLYEVYVLATNESGAQEDNLNSILIFPVQSVFSDQLSSLTIPLTGVVISNRTGPASSVVSSGATALLTPGGTVTLGVREGSIPENSTWTVGTPAWNAPGGLLGANTISSDFLYEVNVTYPNLGSYCSNFTFYATSAVDGTPVVSTLTFVFSVMVMYGVAGQPESVRGSPHPGVLDAYEVTPYSVGGEDLDPAVNYWLPSDEVDLNVYQTLITYNGSNAGPAPNDFVPVIASCVPGTELCLQLFGSDLVSGANFTFVIDNAARFYDPATGNSWEVWPSDVLFSMVRVLGFADVYLGATPGWVFAQALLPLGNSSWDGGIHSPYNNTPQQILSHVLVNDSTFCPAIALSSENGCVTFVANGSDQQWPEFLEFLANPLGASVVPCGWFSAPTQGAGIPYWTENNVTNPGDQSCGVPGAAGFGESPASMPTLGWDAWEDEPFAGNVNLMAVGSGPYYLSALAPNSSYSLEANPAYGSNPNCIGRGCTPEPGSYISSVTVTVTSSFAEALGALANGTADFVSFDEGNTSQVISDLNNGSAYLVTAPTFDVFVIALNVNFNQPLERVYDPSLNVPSDFLNHVALRQFLVHAYPYATEENLTGYDGGVQFSMETGGAIPRYMGDYFPLNVSWPFDDPVNGSVVVGSASWWWAQATDPTSQYFDPELSTCTPTNPCQFPLTMSPTGFVAPTMAQADSWIRSVENLTGGALRITPVLVSLAQAQQNWTATPSTGIGWAPDWPDPSDYINEFYAPGGFLTPITGLASAWNVDDGPNNQSVCYSLPGAASPAIYWANHAVDDDCEMAAYSAMLTAMEQANGLPSTDPSRALLYNLAEHIALNLSVYVYTGQTMEVFATASWVDPATMNTNPMLGGVDFPDGVQTWYSVRTIPAVSHALLAQAVVATSDPPRTFAVGNTVDAGQWVTLSVAARGGTGADAFVWSGLPSGCWSADKSAIKCVPLTPGSFDVSVVVTDSLGERASVSSMIAVNPPPTVYITSSPAAPAPGEPVTFVAHAGTGGTPPFTFSWSFGDGGAGHGSQVKHTFAKAGSFSVKVTLTDQPLDTATASMTVTAGATYSVTFTESGIPAKILAKYGWTVELDGIVTHSTTALIGFTLPNGTYAALITGPSGYRMTGGGVLVYGGTQSVTVSGVTTLSPVFKTGATYTLAFSETGLPTGQSWCVGVDDDQQCSTKASVDYLNLTPASYTYAVVSPLFGQEITTKVGKTVIPMSGTLTVTKSWTVALTFVYPYAVTFTESGLVSGTHWCVTVGKSAECTTGLSIVFNLKNGTYAYRIAVGSGYSVTPMSGTVLVNGEAVPVGLVAYTVTFAESGLPSGTHWCVKLGKTWECSTGVSIVFAEGSGTYAYQVAVPAGSSESPPSGSVVVNGANKAVAINSYAVTFTESGLTSGTNWCVKIGSTNRCSTTTTVVYYLGNGTYAYGIGAIKGYTVTASPAKAQVAGGPAPVTVTFKSKNGQVPGVGAVPLLLGAPLFAPAIKRPRRRSLSRRVGSESSTDRTTAGEKRLPGPGPSPVAAGSVRPKPRYDSGGAVAKDAPRPQTWVLFDRASGVRAVRPVSRPLAKSYSASPSQPVRRPVACLPTSQGAFRSWKAGQSHRCRQPEGRAPRVPNPLRPRIR